MTEYTIQGRKVGMPVEVRDASSGNAMFMVESAGVEKLLPGDSFEPVEAAAGMTQVLLGIIDYRDNDLGDYNEAAIIFFVKPRGGSPEQAGTFIYRLPVNQDFTCEAGFRIWGFPKTVEEIELDYTDTSATGKLVMDGRHVFTLTLPRKQVAAESGDEPLEIFTYTYIEGLPHRNSMSQGGGTFTSPGAEGFRLVLGDHPLADELRGLGLDHATPLLCTWTESMSGVFEAPQPI